MRPLLPLTLFAAIVAAHFPAQAQLLKKLEEKLKAVVPAAGAPTPAAAPKPAPDGGELPPPLPLAEGPVPGYLGIKGDTDPAGGVRVDGFKEIGKAKEAGIKVGDRIIGVNGKKVLDADEFGMLMDTMVSGQTVTLKVSRAGKEQEIKVKLVDPPAPSADSATPDVVVPPGAGGPIVTPRAAATPSRASLGITVITLTDSLKDRLGVPVRRGAVITMVRPGSPAERAGVPVDAVVVAMDGQMISTSEELVEMIRGAKAGTEVELSYYFADKLARKSVKLAPAAAISTLPPGYGGEPPLNLGPPGASRPLLSKVEKIVADITKPGATPGPMPADIVALQQSYSNMQAQMKLLLERIDELEARVKALETAAAPKPEDAPPAAPAKAKPKEKTKGPTLEAPARP